MLRSVKDLHSYTIQAEDGDIGKVHEFYFDDQHWIIRYLVVDTGNWLSDHKVLLSPRTLNKPGWEEKQLPVSLTRDQVEHSPALDSDDNEAIVLQDEGRLLRYEDGPPMDRLGGGLFEEENIGMHPDSIFETLRAKEPGQRTLVFQTPEGNMYLRSTKEVIGYYIQAQDGDIGHVEDFIIDDQTWVIHYMVVDTRNWLPGKKVLISPRWIEQINWPDSNVYVGMTREAIKESPEYNPSEPLDRAYEQRLYDYYDRQKYWTE